VREIAFGTYRLCSAGFKYVESLLTIGSKFTLPAYPAAAAAIDQYLLPTLDLSSQPADAAAAADRRDRRSTLL